MENWVRRIAEAYGVCYDTFLHHALDRTGQGARDLDHLNDRALERLSAGTGVPVEQLRDMQTGLAMARMTERVQGWLESEEGRAALDQLRVSLMRMGPPGRNGQPRPGAPSCNQGANRFAAHRQHDELCDILSRLWG